MIRYYPREGGGAIVICFMVLVYPLAGPAYIRRKGELRRRKEENEKQKTKRGILLEAESLSAA